MKQQTTQKRWYAVRTYSGHENKVKTHIENEIILSKLEDRIFTVLVPSEKIFEIKDGKKKSKTKTFFPGYILVEVILDKETKHLILNTPSVLSFVGPRTEPAPLHAEEVKRLIGRMEERKEIEVMAVPFHIGEPVKVIDGPFNNFTGIVQNLNEEKMKLRVMVSIFGRKTPIELDFNQVEKEK